MNDVLRVEDIDTYYGSSHVLHEVSLTVREGEVVTLIGRNGAGKTTTLRSVMGLTPPESGRIVLGDGEIQGLQPYEVRQRGISWVPEDRRVFAPLTIEKNLTLAAVSGEGMSLERVYELFPHLEERRDQRSETMSGGEQQMLVIARALVGPTTDLLMLDEPSEGLAPQIIEEVRDVIESLIEEGMTILLVEQNADLALDLADRVYVIETGRIEHEGEANALREDERLMREYLGVS
jgi:branched-chain amino acid transport system ATP-binding protein